MGEEDSVILDCEVVLEGQGFVVFFGVVLVGEIVVFVVDVEASASPVFFVPVAALGVDAGFHALVVQRVGFILRIAEVLPS